jgi:vancomycin resistance protein VanJ
VTEVPNTPWRARALNTLLAATAILLLISVALRLGPRDEVWGPSILFYATPWPVLAVGGVLGAWLAIWRRRPRWALAWALSAWALTGAFLGSAWNHPPRSAEPAALRVAYWNVYGGRAGAATVAAAIVELDAEIVCLGEAGRAGHPADWEAFQRNLERALPGYRCVARASTGWIGTRRSDVVKVSFTRRRLERIGGAMCLDLSVGGRPLHLALVDLRSKPWLERKEGIAVLREGLPERDWIALGDFNTPLSSHAFDEWREEGRHAFEEAGAGYRPTWPLPLPVLTLDHVWTGHGLRALRADVRSFTASDHRALVVDLAWSE